MFKQLVICFLLSTPVFAQQKPTKSDVQKIIQVKFGNLVWNQSPEKIDTGVVVLKDSKSNKIVQILLEETAPDSAVFSGTYSVNWGKASKVKPEVYVLEERELVAESNFKKIVQNIGSGKLQKKPLFYRKNEYGVQVLEVFDTKEESKEAIELLRSQVSKPKADETTASKTLGLTPVLIDTSELAELAITDKARRKDIQKRVVDRYRIEKSEVQKKKNALDLFNKMPPPVQKKRSQEAENIGAQALALFKANNYEQATDLFKKAAEADPSNLSYFFQNAISLYKEKKYNEALIAFGVTKNTDAFKKESRYYQGICHYELKEYELGAQVFEEIAATKDEKYAGLAVFYKGLILFDQKEYEKAKLEFSNVLDISNDPKLDERAEKYMESIDQLMAFAKLSAQKYFISASLGLLYDSNVLQTSDSSSDQGSASDQSDYRYLLGLGFYYRPIFNKTHEFGARFKTDYIYTKKDALSDYDPWSWQISTPYSYKTTLFNKSFKLDLKPGYELLHLGQNETSGQPKKLLEAFFLDWGNTFMMSPSWISTYSLNIRKDDFIYDDTKDAKKYTLKYTNIYFVDDSKKKGLIGDLGYVHNDSVADDSDSRRYDLSCMYLTPLNFKEITFVGGVSGYYLRYHNKDLRQEDFNQALNLTFSKPIWENITGALVSSYVLNASNTSTSEYDKWTLGLVLNGEWGM